MSVTGISPSSGPTTGGTAVTITGSGFGESVSAVQIGGAPASFTVVNGSTIRATTPPHAAGTVSVAVTKPSGTETGGSFSYLVPVPPLVQAVTPPTGPATGGPQVTVTGSGFTGATAVSFGGAAVKTFSVPTDKSIIAVLPPHSVGPVSVTVTTPGGTGTGGMFSYLRTAVPAVTGVFPSSGPTAGGTLVRIAGTDLTGTTAVSVAGVPVASFTVDGDGGISAVTAPSAPVSGPVSVTTSAGTGSGGTYAYLMPAPTVGGVTPGSGATTGGTRVTVSGSGFTGARSVSVAGVPVASFSVDDDTAVSAVTAPSAPVSGPVAVTTPAGTGSGGAYAYQAVPPEVTGVAPAGGSTAGGTAVTVTGSGFTGTTAVSVAGVPAASFTVDSDTSLRAVTAASGPVTGPVAVTAYGVTGTGGSYGYVAPVPPVVQAADPASGEVAGGTRVTITGSGFTGATAVSFGGAPATSFAVSGDTSVIATAPAHAAGTVTLAVTTTAGTGSGAAFRYLAPVPPTVTSVSPSSGTTGGGVLVRLTGSGFTGASAVNVAGVPVSAFTVDGDTTITAVTAPAAPGTGPAEVTTAAGTGGGGVFVYAAPPPVIAEVFPDSGPTTGGTEVTVTGAAFTDATGVTVAGTPVSGFTVLGDGVLSLVTAPSNPATGPVVVTTPGGSGSGGAFGYVAPPVPEVTGVTPTTGPTGGGTEVTVTGSGFTGTAAVSVAGVPAASFTVDSDTVLRAVTAPSAAAEGPVAVTRPSGTGTGGNFAYLAPVTPVVGSVSPAEGSTGGGGEVTVTGSGFTGATAVSFGGVPADSFTVPDDTTITAVTPPHAAGPVTVSVTTPAGTGTGGGFTFVAPVVPAVAGDFPGSGPLGGGTAVAVSGSGFTGATAVTAAGVPAASFTVRSDTDLTLVTAPSGPASGPVTVSTTAGTGSGGGFTYLAPVPVVTGVLPVDAPTTGGTEVTITGEGFTGATGVGLAGVPATSFTVEGDSVIRAVTAAAGPVAGPVTVTVDGATGSGASFAYLIPVPPVVAAVEPASGPLTGQIPVTVTGSGFTGAVSVAFGGVPSASFSVPQDTVIIAVAPPHDAGPVAVEVTTAAGLGAGGVFEYLAPVTPTVTGVAPASGGTGGGDLLKITGTGFTGATAVTVAGVAVASFTVDGDTDIGAVTAASIPLSGTVAVTTPAGTAEGGDFTYLAPPPVVVAVSPTAGPVTGGTEVVITGSGFGGTAAVEIAGTPAADFTVLDDGTLVARTGGAAPGSGPVSVSASGGAGSGAAFTYLAVPPTVEDVQPDGGPTTGGTAVTVNGANFTGATAVTVAGVPAASFTVVDDRTIDAVTGASGPVTGAVAVTTPGGTGTGGSFAYTAPVVPVVSAVTPPTGSVAGGTQTLITGTGLSGAVAVSFDGAAAAEFSVADDTSIIAVTPAHAAGAVPVVVTTAAGPSVPGSFAYLAPVTPVVNGVAPSSGPTTGGTLLRVTGGGFTGTTSVSVAGTPVTAFSVDADTSLSAVTDTAPPVVGPVVVTSTAGSGTGGSYAYLAPEPVVAAVRPPVGATLGGTEVLVTGSGFSGATAVRLAGTPAAAFTVVDDTALVAVAAAAPATSGPVTVTADGGTAGGGTFVYLAPPPLTGISVPVGDAPVTVAASPDGSLVYATLFGADAVAVLSTATHQVTGTVPVAAGPWGAAVAPDGGRLYVACRTAGTLDVIDTAAGAVVARVTGLAEPVGLAVTPDGGRVLVACRAADAVCVVDTATDTVTATIPTDTGPGYVVITADGALAYVTEETAGGVSVIDLATGTVTGRFTGFDSPRWPALAVDGGSLYVPEYDGNRLAVVDLATGAVRATVTGLSQPFAVAVPRDGALAYVTGAGDSTVRAVSTGDDVLVATYQGVNRPYGIIVSADDRTLYTAENGSASVGVLPGLLGVYPFQGPTGGGTSVTVLGSRLGGTTAVRFGGRLAGDVVVLDDDALTTVSPAGQGVVGVTVTTPGGTSDAVPFFYLQPPRVTALTPSAGPRAGGTLVTITGLALFTAGTVSFGGTDLHPVVLSDSEIVLTTPPGAAGGVAVSVTTVGGAVDGLEFSYLDHPVVTAFTPSSGPAAGGTSVTIDGAALSLTTSVAFGGVPAVSFVVVSDSRLEAVTPAHAAGQVSLGVTTPGGSATAATTFTYL